MLAEGEGDAMTWLMTTAGVALIVLALRDIFHTLWHPGGFGSLSRMVFASIWRVTKLINRSRATELAGPWGLLATLALWTLLMVIGFSLVYLPRMPGGFYFGSSLEPGASSDVVASLYLSVVALATLGLGDIEPATALLRLVVPVEALLGFLLLTAGISWVLQLYPALIRRRALARRLTTMARHGAAEVVRTGEPSIAVQLLEGVRGDVAAAEMDLVQYGESYYFRESSTELSLAAAMSYVATLAAAGQRSASPEVRQAAAMLDSGLSAFLDVLRRDFLAGGSEASLTLAAFARDHQHPQL